MKKSIFIILPIMLLAANFKENDQVSSEVYKWKKLKVNQGETRESRPILEGSTAHLSYFEAHATTLYPGKMPHGKHTHDNDEELVIVREGRIKITTPNYSKELGPGGIALLIPGEEHGLENVGDEKAIYYIMKFRSKKPMNVQRSLDAGGSMVIDRADLEFKTHSKGGRWNYFERATAACEEFEMHVTKLSPGITSHAPHTHEREEIFIMLAGKAKIHIDGEEYEVETGDVAFTEGTLPHGISNIGDIPCEYFAFQWK